MMNQGKRTRHNIQTQMIPLILTIISALHSQSYARTIDAFVSPSRSTLPNSFSRHLPGQHFEPTIPPHIRTLNEDRSRFPWQSSLTSTSLFALKDISSMKASEMRAELETYGISTKSFFEKSEFAEALGKARAEGKTPVKDPPKSTKSKSTASASASASDSVSREEKLAQEMAKIQSMKVGDIKKELASLGISTKSFFEKYEFVKALAEARVDGTKKSGKSGSQGPVQEEEEYDPSYRDVVMQKFSAGNPMLGGLSGVIDVRLAK